MEQTREGLILSIWSSYPGCSVITVLTGEWEAAIILPLQKIGLLRSVGIFQGCLGAFLGYLEWVGPNRKYFLEAEGPAVIFPNAQGPQQNLQEAWGPKSKMVRNYGFLGFIF
jgi:hypothetical protein